MIGNAVTPRVQRTTARIETELDTGTGTVFGHETQRLLARPFRKIAVRGRESEPMTLATVTDTASIHARSRVPGPLGAIPTTAR
jgi:hypothetical protein